MSSDEETQSVKKKEKKFSQEILDAVSLGELIGYLENEPPQLLDALFPALEERRRIQNVLNPFVVGALRPFREELGEEYDHYFKRLYTALDLSFRRTEVMVVNIEYTIEVEILPKVDRTNIPLKVQLHLDLIKSKSPLYDRFLHLLPSHRRYAAVKTPQQARQSNATSSDSDSDGEDRNGGEMDDGEEEEGRDGGGGGEDRDDPEGGGEEDEDECEDRGVVGGSVYGKDWSGLLKKGDPGVLEDFSISTLFSSEVIYSLELQRAKQRANRGSVPRRLYPKSSHPHPIHSLPASIASNRRAGVNASAANARLQRNGGVAKPRRTSTSPSAARKNEVNEAASSNAARLAQLLSPASAKSEDQDEKSERYFGRGTTKEGKRAGVGSMIVTMVSGLDFKMGHSHMTRALVEEEISSGAVVAYSFLKLTTLMPIPSYPTLVGVSDKDPHDARVLFTDNGTYHGLGIVPPAPPTSFLPPIDPNTSPSPDWDPDTNLYRGVARLPDGRRAGSSGKLKYKMASGKIFETKTGWSTQRTYTKGRLDIPPDSFVEYEFTIINSTTKLPNCRNRFNITGVVSGPAADVRVIQQHNGNYVASSHIASSSSNPGAVVTSSSVNSTSSSLTAGASLSSPSTTISGGGINDEEDDGTGEEAVPIRKKRRLRLAVLEEEESEGE